MARRVRREIVEDDVVVARPSAREQVVIRERRGYAMNPIALVLAILIGLFLLWLIFGMLL